MSRIGILTFLHNGNYGSCLQAYALQRVLRTMGNDCEHIDYQPDLQEKIRNMIRCGNSLRLLVDGKRKRKVRTEQSGIQKKYKLIQTFYEQHMNLSPVCRNHEALIQIEKRYDILMCGSDQIWNPVWMNPSYFLDFAPPDKPRIAYAASLGISVVPGRRKQNLIRHKLSLFDAVSVREEEGARILVSMTGLRPSVVPDPVCLLTGKEWEEVAAPMQMSRKSMVCYFIGENPAYWDQAEAIGREKGLEPLVIPVTADAYEQGRFALLDGAGPEEFLGAILNAEEICTDSFHGLAFGTIMGKKVHLIRRDRDDSRESKNSRTDHFLREVKNKGLENMRQEGLNWLDENIRNIQKTI